ncbi:thioredoxin-like protein [Schizopora paradoxa]|uniref:Thioredoxin-like protein n=1 Tax=Schizopora paradoxa TaxID=27342 RepID=A0A0H2SMG4_9AGAM|nr:thioredoxin-like protein [Schizopora paradoxa]
MSTATNPAEPRTIRVDVTSDSICPFCFLGKRKLERAVEIANNEKGLNVKLDIQYHPFLLDPTLTTDKPVDKRERYYEKFGKERFVQMENMMKERGKEVGINFSYGGKLRQTTDSHRLFALAYDKGGEKMQQDLVERIFAGYFEQEKDVGDADFLAEQAVQASVFANVDEAKAWLKSDAKITEVAKGIREAQMMGITGVPFFVLNKKYALSGAQDPEVFVEVFERLSGQQETRQVAPGMVC